MPLDNVVFWVFAPLSVATGLCMIMVRSAVHAALFLVVNFFTIAVMYLLLDAPFLFAVQIIVYAGAIMVLFLFVIMLLGVDQASAPGDRLVGQRTTAVILGVAIVAELATAIRAGVGFATRAPEGFDAVNPG
ncbi:MAG: NADH-quinone oxidoreductase subunit J, partial [Actinomycetota bacterium]